MAGITTLYGDVAVTGLLTANDFSAPAGSLTNAMIVSSAGIEATKLEHQYTLVYAQESATTAADESRVIHAVYGQTGDVIRFECGCVVANIGNSTVTFDLKKNGTSILTAPAEVNSTHAARELVAGTLTPTVPTLAADDVLEVVINATAGTGTLGKGAFCRAIIREDAT